MKSINCEYCQDSGVKVIKIDKPTGIINREVTCTECCEHGDYDHGICGFCDEDCTNLLVQKAESYYEGER